MADVRAIVTRAFWLGGEIRPVGSVLTMDDNLYAELNAMGKVVSGSIPVAADAVVTDSPGKRRSRKDKEA